MNKLDDMHAFVVLAEAGSITAAANQLGVAKSVVSRRLARLEARLGTQLLRRTTRRSSLTDSGRSFYESASRILADIDDAESAFAGQRGELSGKLRLALPLSFGIAYMPAPIDAFIERHPGIAFDINLNDRRIDLVGEGIDLALRIGNLADSSLIARKLFDAHLVLCASPEYLARYGQPDTLQALTAHRVGVYTNTAEPTRLQCEDGEGRAQAVTVLPALSATSGDFLIEMAKRGHGIVLQPTFMAARAIAAGELEPVLSSLRWPATPAYAIYPQTRHLSLRVRAFIDHLVDWFSGPQPWDDCRAITTGLAD